MKLVIFLLYNNLYLYRVLCTLIYRRRSLYSFLFEGFRYLGEILLGGTQDSKTDDNKNGYARPFSILWYQPAEHYSGIIMGAMASQITSLTNVYSTAYSGTDQRKHQIFVSLTFLRGIHRWPVNSLHIRPVTGKMFPFDDNIMGAGVVWRTCLVPSSK